MSYGWWVTAEAKTQGTLTACPLPEVLHSLETEKATGVLHLATGGEIWLASGRCYLVNSPTAPALSSVLFGADVGSLEEVEDLLTLPEASDETPATEESALDQICSAYPESGAAVQRLMHEHNLNGLFEMIVPSDQEYTFRADEVHQLGARFGESTSELMAKASARVDTWRKIATRIPSTAAVFRLAHALPGRAQERLFSADEWRYLSYLDGQASIASVITETGESAFRVTSALYRLLLEDIIVEKLLDETSKERTSPG